MKIILNDEYKLLKEGKLGEDSFIKKARVLHPKLIKNSANIEETINILKGRNILNEGYVDLQPIDMSMGKSKEDFENAFEVFLKEQNEPQEFENEQELINYLMRVQSFNEEEAEIFAYDYSTKYVYPATTKEIEIELKRTLNEAKAVEKKTSKEVIDQQEATNYDYKETNNINNVSFQQTLMGYRVEMSNPKNSEKTHDQLLDIVVKNISKDPTYYTTNSAFGVEGIGYEYMSEEIIAGKNDQMEEVKLEDGSTTYKSNTSDTKDTPRTTDMKTMPVNPKSQRGVKKMKTPGKEKKISKKNLNESIDDSDYNSEHWLYNDASKWTKKNYPEYSLSGIGGEEGAILFAIEPKNGGEELHFRGTEENNSFVVEPLEEELNMSESDDLYTSKDNPNFVNARGDFDKDQYANLLQNLSSETLDPRSFGEFIEDYYKNPDDYNIDTNSDYYSAIEYAWNEFANETRIPVWQPNDVENSPLYQKYLNTQEQDNSSLEETISYSDLLEGDDPTLDIDPWDNIDTWGDEEEEDDPAPHDDEGLPLEENVWEDTYFPIFSKYVEDPDDIDKYLTAFDDGGLEALPNWLVANLTRDEDFIKYTHDKGMGFVNEEEKVWTNTSIPTLVFYNLEDAKIKAQMLSQKDGVVYHVNQTGDRYELDIFYDEYTTVASYENGRSLNEEVKQNLKELTDDSYTLPDTKVHDLGAASKLLPKTIATRIDSRKKMEQFVGGKMFVHVWNAKVKFEGEEYRILAYQQWLRDTEVGVTHLSISKQGGSGIPDPNIIGDDGSTTRIINNLPVSTDLLSQEIKQLERLNEENMNENKDFTSTFRQFLLNENTNRSSSPKTVSIDEGNLGPGETSSLREEYPYWIVTWKTRDNIKDKSFTSEEEARRFLNNLDPSSPSLYESKKTPISKYLKEIDKAGDKVALEAKINAIDELIEKCSSRLKTIDENEGLEELMDKKAIKGLHKEIKLLEKQKEKYNKIYEKMTGSTKKEVIAEPEGEIESEVTEATEEDIDNQKELTQAIEDTTKAQEEYEDTVSEEYTENNPPEEIAWKIKEELESYVDMVGNENEAVEMYVTLHPEHEEYSAFIKSVASSLF